MCQARAQLQHFTVSDTRKVEVSVGSKSLFLFYFRGFRKPKWRARGVM